MFIATSFIFLISGILLVLFLVIELLSSQANSNLGGTVARRLSYCTTTNSVSAVVVNGLCQVTTTLPYLDA